ncbi:uncharacterized protein [Saccopteryx leptura]|uniref:uncharacterized protein n=1 Tax=Saccopteryx leptura TaxID=249018 RepID=UPI00339CC0C2
MLWRRALILVHFWFPCKSRQTLAFLVVTEESGPGRRSRLTCGDAVDKASTWNAEVAGSKSWACRVQALRRVWPQGSSGCGLSASPLLLLLLPLLQVFGLWRCRHQPASTAAVSSASAARLRTPAWTASAVALASGLSVCTRATVAASTASTSAGGLARARSDCLRGRPGLSCRQRKACTAGGIVFELGSLQRPLQPPPPQVGLCMPTWTAPAVALTSGLYVPARTASEVDGLHHC